MTEPAAWVIDASSLLAALFDEPGGALVRDAASGSIMSAVNWCEVLQKANVRGLDIDAVQRRIAVTGPAIQSFTATAAQIAAGLFPSTASFGLSLADRACLALAIERSLPVMTADRSWAELALPIEVRLIR